MKTASPEVKAQVRQWFANAEQGLPAASREEQAWRDAMQLVNDQLAAEFLG